MSRNRRARRKPGDGMNHCNKCGRWNAPERHLVDHYCPRCRNAYRAERKQAAKCEVAASDPRFLGSQARELANLLAR